jgi:hypothetical protein
VDKNLNLESDIQALHRVLGAAEMPDGPRLTRTTTFYAPIGEAAAAAALGSRGRPPFTPSPNPRLE